MTNPARCLSRSRDSGPGLDFARAQRLFEAFFTTKPEGMGMGLSICRSIIDTHGGRLWASPNLPNGSYSVHLAGGRGRRKQGVMTA